ncbi:methionine ABC transporter ATP-binding protein [Aquisalimonas asiatica]|uniref:Cell division ATP-binding protein FtsE n=1 Tax=Aquisalimonas asiatica TaxID=406100 RepID=A0A1H8SME5_9GAMM|nr:methionine ABC transporter ATP-binding protein [Aquisalimonas asiatica]SEO79373.1 D-methionine transport system ATP-binding protein [Aquisalimonas asiatica]
MIEFEDVQKSYRVEGRDVSALRDINLEVRAGEVFGVIGHSGAGKSTLLRLINLIERPSSGRIRIDGEDITDSRGGELMALRRGIGMIFQHFNLLSSKTVAENVRFPMKLAGTYSRDQMQHRVDHLLDRVGLADQANKYPAQLSGGQKQRVGIARSLACEPRILLCDEATSALDPQTTQSVLRLLGDINRELGLTIVLITHEMDAIRTICDRVAVLDAGEVVEQGTAAQVFLHPRHQTTQRFVFETEHIDEDERQEDFAHVPGRVLRLTFQGEATYTPMLGDIARRTGVDYSILSGRIDHIKDIPYGQITLSLIGGDTDSAEQALHGADVSVEVLRP